MNDPRWKKLAETLVHYSCAVKAGEKVLVESKGDETSSLVKEIVTEIAKAGGLARWYHNEEEVERRWVMHASEEQIKGFGQVHLKTMKDTTCYISVRGANNAFALADVPEKQRQWYQKYFYKPVHLEQRVKRTRWVVLRYPNHAMSQLAETSREAFEDFFFSVCNVDYGKMSKAMDPLAALMSKTERVRIVGPGTDLTFSIKGIPQDKCDGHRNIPDGPVHTPPNT